jgi:hypothetical protein
MHPSIGSRCTRANVLDRAPSDAASSDAPCSGRDLKECPGWQVRAAFFSAAIVVLALGGGARAESGGLSIELNKLESQDNSCRAYLVVTNKSTTTYKVLKLDLVLFQPDGVIGRRVAIDLGPLQSDKRTVKLFDIDTIPCDQVGNVLINDVLECKSELGPIADCLAAITPSSLAKAPLTK